MIFVLTVNRAGPDLNDYDHHGKDDTHAGSNHSDIMLPLITAVMVVVAITVIQIVMV